MTRTERQILGVNKWKESNGRATLCWATGCGKTNGACIAINRVLKIAPDTIIKIIVPTKVLKDQWNKVINKLNISGNIEILIINSAIKKKFKCNFLIIDEVHKVASELFSKLFLNCNPRLILGLTATYERLDQREKIILDKYCPVCDTITIKEATENGWLSSYKEYQVLIDVDLSEYDKANQEFLNHFAFFNYNFDEALQTVTNIWKQQKIAKEKNCTIKEVKAHAMSWMRALKFRKSFIANHPIKLEYAKKILEYRKNCKAITFNSNIKQCESYGFGYIVHSKKSKKKNQMTLEEFSKCSSGNVIHSSKMLIEGLDCAGLNLAIITGFNSSNTTKIQEIGRCIRYEPDKKVEIFTLVLKGTVEEKWYQKSMKDLYYISLNESDLMKVLNNEELINKELKTGFDNNSLLRL